MTAHLSANHHDGSDLRIAIVHSRFHMTVIDALVGGAVSKLKECGVKDKNLVILSVPGSFELPMACSTLIASSCNQASVSTVDPVLTSATRPFDAIIAIGVGLKGPTMHFDLMCDSVSHALMKTQLDTGVPIIFGLVAALHMDHALERAGLGKEPNKGYNHGDNWGLAAVEMALHRKNWVKGVFE